MRKLILGHGSEAIGTIIQNLEMLARRVTLVLVWRSSMSHSLSDGCGYCLTRVGACCPA